MALVADPGWSQNLQIKLSRHGVPKKEPLALSWELGFNNESTRLSRRT